MEADVEDEAMKKKCEDILGQLKQDFELDGGSTTLERLTVRQHSTG